VKADFFLDVILEKTELYFDLASICSDYIGKADPYEEFLIREVGHLGLGEEILYIVAGYAKACAHYSGMFVDYAGSDSKDELNKYRMQCSRPVISLCEDRNIPLCKVHSRLINIPPSLLENPDRPDDACRACWTTCACTFDEESKKIPGAKAVDHRYEGKERRHFTCSFWTCDQNICERCARENRCSCGHDESTSVIQRVTDKENGTTNVNFFCVGHYDKKAKMCKDCLRTKNLPLL
jgi:hypothetical protein